MAATAVETWDERWATPEGRDDWLEPRPAVAAMVPVLEARGTQHVLDLGCGVGRHALLFAEHGFVVEAIDGAAAGLDFARREAGRNFGNLAYAVDNIYDTCSALITRGVTITARRVTVAWPLSARRTASPSSSCRPASRWRLQNPGPAWPTPVHGDRGSGGIAARNRQRRSVGKRRGWQSVRARHKSRAGDLG